jgi:hypothetical protein
MINFKLHSMTTLRCKGGCGRFVSFEDKKVGPRAEFLCRECAPPDSVNDGLHFQSFAFDPELKNQFSYDYDLTGLLGVIDGEKISEGQGFQIHNARREERLIPEWAQTPEGMQKILLTAFPKLKTDSSQRKRAARWARVMWLYFCVGLPYSEVAYDLGENPRIIEHIIQAIIRTSEGKTWRGKPRKRFVK